VSAISGYWKTTSPLTVPWSATDNLRLSNVTLEYRYRATNVPSFTARRPKVDSAMLRLRQKSAMLSSSPTSELAANAASMPGT
jgi:hypothetical protein